MKKNQHTVWLASLGLVLILATILVLPASSQLPPGKLVSAEWLEQNLPSENLRIIDVRQSIMDYWQNHIPGAVYFNPEALRLADRGVPGKLMPPEALVIMLGKMGVSGKTTVVVCGEQNDFRATYLIWALDYLGHPSSMMLEGGFDKWSKEKRPLTQDYPEVKPVEYGSPAEMNQEVRATLQEVKGVVSQGGAVLIDVRPAQLYTGEKGLWKRRGRIKGAINHFWGEDINEDGSWKSKEELRRVYEELGATPEKAIIVSCGQGLMSSHAYFTLKHILGYPNVKNYDGSFNEWSNVDELPVETGVPDPVD